MRTMLRALLLMVASALCAGPALAQDPMAVGKKLFTRTAVPACATCHTLAHAQATGTVGPNLDELRPDASRVEQAIRNGVGQMPAFAALSDEQVRALSLYVARAADGK